MIDTPQHLIEQQGEWAIDCFSDHMMETRYFQTREEANQFKAIQGGGFTLRRVNLEDAFLALTGKKVKA